MDRIERSAKVIFDCGFFKIVNSFKNTGIGFGCMINNSTY
jgi:hypothetical protein